MEIYHNFSPEMIKNIGYLDYFQYKISQYTKLTLNLKG